MCYSEIIIGNISNILNIIKPRDACVNEKP